MLHIVINSASWLLKELPAHHHLKINQIYGTSLSFSKETSTAVKGCELLRLLFYALQIFWFRQKTAVNPDSRHCIHYVVNNTWKTFKVSNPLQDYSVKWAVRLSSQSGTKVHIKREIENREREALKNIDLG